MCRISGAVASILLLAFLLGGCAAPTTEINYRCVLPKIASADADPDLASVFASELAASARLQVLSQTRLKGKVSKDITFIVSMKSSAAAGVFVNVLFNQPYRTVAVTIAGDIRNPEAGVIIQKAVKVFSAMFPGSNLVPFSGNQALFGP